MTHVHSSKRSHCVYNCRMSMEWVFRFLFLALFAGAVAVRVHFQRQAGTYDRGVSKHAEGHLANEAKPLLIIRPLLGIPWYVMVIFWFVAPRWIKWFTVALPVWARFMGIVLGACGLFLLWRGHAAMGKNFRPTLEVAPDQELVTTGPYRIIRHPIYVAFLIMLASTGLLSANWFIGIVGVLLIASITLVRIPAEEAALDARFGERYRKYKETTPAIFPLGGRTFRS